MQHLLKSQELQVKSGEVHRRFWELVREGCSTEEAAAAVGVGKQTAQGRFGKAGGVAPTHLSARPQ